MTDGYEMAKSELTDAEDNPQSAADDPPGKKWKQFAAAIVANFAGILAGCVIGWTSPSIPHLEADDSPVPITTEENSWISSLMPLAAAVGPWPAGYFAKKFGPKKGILFSFVPSVISYGCLAGATSVPVIYVGRIFSGLFIGWIFTILPMYCGEIAHKDVRGAIGSMMQLLISVGLLFDYGIGPYVPYMWLSVATFIFPILLVVGFVWMPDSPYYLLAHDQPERAKESLIWLRGSPHITHELKNIQADVEKAQSQTGSFKDLFANKGIIKAVLLTLALMFFQQFSGINVVLFNAQSIFTSAGGSLTPEVSTIITGLVMFIASIVTPLLVDRLGRRILLLTSAIGMAVSQAVLGLCFFLANNGTDTSSFAVLPVLSVVLYIFLYSIGFGPLPWAIMGEMFPSNIKSLASTCVASFCWFLGFLITQFFNQLVSAIGNDYTFWLFAIFCVIATLFVIFLMPETKGKTLAEIQELLSR